MMERNSIQESYNVDELEITRYNIDNWLRFIKDLYHLNRSDREAIERFIHRRDKQAKERLLDDIFGKEY